MPRPSHPTASRALAAALLCAAARGLAAQGLGEGFELERAGRTQQAAAAYLAAVRSNPTDVAALLGLERVLPSLERTSELLPLAARAAALDTTSEPLRGLLVRSCVMLGALDSAAAVARRWARWRPRSDTPYREWAIALSDVRAYGAAREAFLAGRKALGQPAVFAVELAELAQRTGDWEIAAGEWGLAVTAAPANLVNAAGELGDAPVERQDRVIHVLAADGPSPARLRLAGYLALQWGDPERGWSLFEASLGPASPDDARALYRYADLAAQLGTAPAWRVRGKALGRFAELVPGPLAVRARADAARAFLAAGDAAQAQAQLALVANDPAAPLEAQQLAQATLVRALIQGDQVDSAEALLGRATLKDDDRTELRYALVRARIRRGELALADVALAGDSSVEASALRGRIALYRGDLRTARELLQAAGPYAGDRDDATERTALVALIVQVSQERAPLLGAALLTLARGDSGAAVSALRRAADQLPVEGGRADVLLLAGRVAARQGGGAEGTAASLFAEVIRIGGTGGGAAAPAAELEWARLFARQGQNAQAREHLEHLILTYPGSAVVPEARRELERMKGAIPRS